MSMNRKEFFLYCLMLAGFPRLYEAYKKEKYRRFYKNLKIASIRQEDVQEMLIIFKSFEENI